MKRYPPDLEDMAFARAVNDRLVGHASIDLFSVDFEGSPQVFKLVMSHRGHRRTINSSAPFPFQGVAEIVSQVERWLGTLTNPNAKWTTDTSFA